MNVSISILRYFLILLLLTISLRAQTLDWERAAKFNNPTESFIRNTVMDQTGNVYLSGYVTGSKNPDSVGTFLNKYGPNGSLLWSKIINDNLNYSGGGVFLDKTDNAWLVCFHVSGKLAVNSHTYMGARTFIVHFNPSGDVVTVKKVSYLVPWGIAQDGFSNVYIGGIGKVDTNGTVLLPLKGRDIAADDSGYVFQQIQTFDNRLRKLKANGDSVWSIVIPESSKIAVSRKGNIAVIGGIDVGTPTFNYYGRNGNFLWSNTFSDAAYRDVYIDENETVYLLYVSKNPFLAGKTFVDSFEPLTGRSINSWQALTPSTHTYIPGNLSVRNGIVCVALDDIKLPGTAIVQRYYNESVLPTGIAEQYFNDITISPNPSTGIFKINGTDETIRVMIINSEGKVIQHVTGSKEITIDLSGSPKGLYLLRGNSLSGTFVKKIIKE